MPERAHVVVNTTPLIALAEIHHIDLLRQLYGEILVPPAVRAEVIAGGSSGVDVEKFTKADFIRTVPLGDPRRLDFFVDLDRGEAEVIALAEEMEADLVIIDELLGRKHAQRLGMNVTGSIGVLIKAKQMGILSRIAPLLKAWQSTGRQWFSESLQRALLMTGEEM